MKLFGAGKLNAMILNTLRRGGRPMSLPEITEGVAGQSGFGEEARKGLTPRVRANLLYLVKVRQLVAKDGERATARWRIAE